MRKKIFIALDGSEGSMSAVEQVKDVTRGNRDLEITLFHVCLDPPSLLEHWGSEDPTRERELSSLAASAPTTSRSPLGRPSSAAERVRGTEVVPARPVKGRCAPGRGAALEDRPGR
ncbi:MAG: universal stress protein [Acidobacteria bacterium]|nr:universal stress protein [Acidobacteriota bacterium]